MISIIKKQRLLFIKWIQSVWNILKGHIYKLLIHKQKKIIDEWDSTQEGHVIEGLVVDRLYILHGNSSSYRLYHCKDQEFTIQDQEDEQSIRL